jgi:soluble lytic murein transglycosylase-like protein
MHRVLVGALVSVGLLLATPADGDVYKYVDENGVVHFTNIPNDRRFERLAPPGSPPAARKRKASKPRKSRRRSGRLKRRIIDNYDHIIEEAADRFNIPATLIKAVIVVESNFNPKAVSHAGAQGLMQLMPQTAAEMGVEDVFDPRQNILGGTRYLRHLANAYEGDLVLTLAGYNAGQKAVNRHMDIPPITETQRYVRRVLKLYYHFKDEARQQARPPPGGESR